MLCNRCWKELPSHTPICPGCGPVTLGSGFTPPPPPPPIRPVATLAFAAPGVGGLSATAVAGPAREHATRPAPPPPVAEGPAAAAREGRRSKSEAKRLRKALARAAMGQPAPETGTETPEAAQERVEVAVARPRPVTRLAQVDLVLGGVGVFLLWAGLTQRIPPGAGGPTTDMGAVLHAGHALALLAAAVGLLSLDRRGWVLQLALSAIGIFGGFLSAAASIGTLVYLLRPGVWLLFSGRRHFTHEERGKIEIHTPSPRLVRFVVFVQVVRALVALVPVLGITG